MASIVNRPRYEQQCCRCGKTMTLDKYYSSNSIIYSNTNTLPVCRACVDLLFNNYKEQYGSSKKALKRICMAFDLYYSDTICEKWISAEEDGRIGRYIQRISISANNNKNFESSINEGFSFKERLVNETEGESENDLAKDIERWGIGFAEIDYEILNAHYKVLNDANPNRDAIQETFIEDLCYTQMQKMKALREGRSEDYQKLTKSYRELFTQSGFQTTKQSKQDEFTLGIGAEVIERYTPAEYYKDKQLYKDFDGLGSYFKRMILRPLKNLQHGTDDRDEEFYVKDPEE